MLFRYRDTRCFPSFVRFYPIKFIQAYRKKLLDIIIHLNLFSRYICVGNRFLGIDDLGIEVIVLESLVQDISKVGAACCKLHVTCKLFILLASKLIRATLLAVIVLCAGHSPSICDSSINRSERSTHLSERLIMVIARYCCLRNLALAM